MPPYGKAAKMLQASLNTGPRKKPSSMQIVELALSFKFLPAYAYTFSFEIVNESESLFSEPCKSSSLNLVAFLQDP